MQVWVDPNMLWMLTTDLLAQWSQFQSAWSSGSLPLIFSLRVSVQMRDLCAVAGDSYWKRLFGTGHSVHALQGLGRKKGVSNQGWSTGSSRQMPLFNTNQAMLSASPVHPLKTEQNLCDVVVWGRKTKRLLIFIITREQLWLSKPKAHLYYHHVSN